MKFNLTAQDPQSKARAGEITTDHGTIQTPIFMPVGTAGAMKGGGKGAGIGAGAGAGAGAIAGLLTDHDLRLEKGTVLEVRLDHPLQIPAR